MPIPESAPEDSFDEDQEGILFALAEAVEQHQEDQAGGDEEAGAEHEAVALEACGGRIGVALRVASTIVSYFLFGAVLVLLAVWIAPSHQSVVAPLAVLFSILEAWRRCVMYRDISRLAYPNAIARVLGSIIAAYIS